MDAENTSDLFDIKLSEDGIGYIRKFTRIVKFVIVIGILISAISITMGLYSQLSNKFDLSVLSYWRRVYFASYPFFQFLHAALFLVQIYFYWRFRQSLAFAINYKNEISFNQSFLFLYKNAIWAAISMSSAFIFSVFDLIYILTITD